MVMGQGDGPSWFEEHPYLSDLADAFITDPMKSDRLRRVWEERFQTVHFERYNPAVPAAIAEVTPKDPPYEYSSKRNWERNRWHWRQVLVVYQVIGPQASLGQLMQDFARLYIKVTRYTDRQDGAVCQRYIRLALEDCVNAHSCVASVAGRPEASNDITADTRRLLYDEIKALYERCAARRTVTQYILGMIIGLLLVPGIVGLNFLVFHLFSQGEGIRGVPDYMAESVLTGLLGGSSGALASVLLRINDSNSVNLDVEATRHGWMFWTNPVMQRGIGRIIIGCLFGGAIAWCVESRLILPEAFRTEGSSTILIIGVVAFVAGFSERFVPDLILRQAKN
jgi:hypothetical protein